MVQWWDRLIDSAVRVESRKLTDAELVRRKLVHTGQLFAAWPFMWMDRRVLGLALLGSCSFVAATQRRIPYASLGLFTLLLCVHRTALGGAWAVFTAGDGVAGIAGRAIGGPRLPWNQRKTWSGSLGFVTAATAALLPLLHQRLPAMSARQRVTVAVMTSATAAMVESLDTPLDDNYSVIVVAGAVLDTLVAACRHV